MLKKSYAFRKRAKTQCEVDVVNIKSTMTTIKATDKNSKMSVNKWYELQQILREEQMAQARAK